jgi:ABC-2 type transport system ATP-binding protein
MAGAMSDQHPDAPALQLQHLTKVYADGTRALDELSLTIPRGSFFGLLGPNGAGKSTLIRIITGLVRATSGQARVFGHDALRHPIQARALTGLAPQEPNLDRFLTVRETLRYQGGYSNLPRRAALAKADELLEAFDLQGKAGVRTTRLSGGMKRRLLLAKAFMHDPPLVILDEPTAGVDVELRMELHSYIRRVHESGRTVLLTTHYLEEAEALCDELALIRDGRIAARGRASELKAEHGVASVEQLYLRVIHR